MSTDIDQIVKRLQNEVIDACIQVIAEDYREDSGDESDRALGDAIAKLETLKTANLGLV